MKKSLVVSALLAAAGVLYGANLFPNPGFEKWNPKETVNTKLKVFEQTSEIVHTGKYALHFKDADAGPSNGTYSIVFPASFCKKYAGKPLYFSGWVKQIRASGSSCVGLAFWYKTSSGKGGAVSIGTGTKGETDWQFLKTKIILPQDATLLFVQLHCANGFYGTADAYFDDLYLTDNPEEAASQAKKPAVTTETKSVLKEKPVAATPFGYPYLKLHPLPRSCFHNIWGGFRWETSPSSIDYLYFKMPDGLSKYGGFAVTTNMLNRHYDLTKLPAEDLSLVYRSDIKVPATAHLIGDNGKIHGVADMTITKLADGTWLYQVPFTKFKVRLSDVGRFQVQYPAGIREKHMKVFDFGIYSSKPFTQKPVYSVNKDASEFLKIYTKKVAYTADKSPTEIRNGVFYVDGKPEMFIGPWIYCTVRDWKKGMNPLNIKHIAYTTRPGVEVWDAVGFNSAQISAAWRIPGQALYGLGVPYNWRELEKEQEEYFRGFGKIPMVMDFAFGFNSELHSDNPKLAHDLDQCNPSWHAFIPFCPEHPEGDRYYKAYMEGGVRNALDKGANIIGYELFNESNYNCCCIYNRREFVKRMQKKYSAIRKANAVWGTNFASWDDVVRQSNYQLFRGVWPDWCKFSGDRYAEILKHYADFIRTIDKRPGIWFCEQISGINIDRETGAGMDYRRIANVMDVVTTEGGLAYGKYSRKSKAQNEMEEVVFSSGTEILFSYDFFRALGHDKKPVTNNEHYNTRGLREKRVPSRRTDMITSLWTEMMHGVSASYTYVWDKRAFEIRTMKDAKEASENRSYKSSSYLNPYNWPPDTLDCFRSFRQELEPYKEKVLPLPRTKPATVALFHSYPTLRMLCYHRIPFSRIMHNVHGILTNNQYPLMIVWEKELENLPSSVRTVIVPCAHYATPETVKSLNAFVKKGGTVLVDKNAFQWDEYGHAMPVKGEGFRKFDVSSRTLDTDLLKLLAEAKVPRYGKVEPLDGKKISASDFQIIDRGDFKLVFYANFGDLETRKVNLKLFIDPKEGEFFVTDIVSGRSLLHQTYLFGRSAKWNSEDLAKGILLAVPPQERIVLTLERKLPKKGLKEFSSSDMESLYRQMVKAEKPALDAIRKAAEEADAAAKKARLWEGVCKEKCVSVDISKFVNMAFADKTAGDQKGGWFDQGSNDFAKMPLGKQVFAGVPFTIIDPAKNHGKSTMVFYSRHRAFFPKAVKNIPVNMKAKYVYLLHTYGWDPAKGTKVLYYTFHYADGTQEVLTARALYEIGPWWGAEAIPEAKIAVESSNFHASEINMQCCRWTNPHPEKVLKSIDIESVISDAVPSVSGITVEKP